MTRDTQAAGQMKNEVTKRLENAGRGGRSGPRWWIAPAGPALCAVLAAATPAPAAPAPATADTQLQQNETRLQQTDQQTQTRQQGPAVITAPLTRASLPPKGGLRVLVRSVVFEPQSAFLTVAELDAIAAHYVGRKLDFADISALVRDVNDLYAKKGIVTASAILPPQKLTSGVLKVELVEGRLGKVSVVGDHQTPDKFLLDRIRLTKGETVDVPTAAEDITWFNKTSRAQLRLLLQPGASFGLTDLALGITEPPRNQLQFFLDNEGVKSTGTVEWGGFYRNYGPMGIDDSLMVYATGSLGSLSGTVSYDLPVTKAGARLALSYTRSGIRVIDGPTAPLDVTGVSQATTVTLSQPVVANRDWTLLVLASGSYALSDSKSGDTPLVDSDTTKAVLGFALTYASDRANFTVQPQLIYAKAHDRLTDQVQGILLSTGTVSGVVRLPNDFRLVANGGWQYTHTSLLPGDLLFQVGGATTVRGYPSDAVAGDSGYYAQAELHKDLSALVPGLDAFAFTDVGEVFSTFPSHTLLASAGVGLSVNWNDKVTAELSAGFPILDAVSDQPVATVYARITGKAF